MSIADQLRAEARDVPATAAPDLVPRVRAAIAAAGPSPVSRRQPIRFPVYAVAASLLLAVGILWAMRSNDSAAVPVPTPVVVAPRSLPAPPSLGEVLQTAGGQAPAQAVDGELSALGTDLAAVMRTVRDVVPF